MASNIDYDKYYVEKEVITLDSDDEFEYEEVPVDDDLQTEGIEEDLDAAVRTIREAAEDNEAQVARESLIKPSVSLKPEVVDDFVRNFLIRMGLCRTLDCFQTEWYELQERGFIQNNEIGCVPDIYTVNQELENNIEFLKKEATKFRDAASMAKETYVKLRKERDFHRMHHKRIVQEKNKLIDDIKRLKRHYAHFAPNMETLKSRYEAAMKERMLATLERDRAVGQLSELQNTLKNMEKFSGTDHKPEEQKVEKGPTQRQLLKERQKTAQGADGDVKTLPPAFKRYVNDSDFPVDMGVNPYLSQAKTPAGTSVLAFRLTNTFSAHTNPVSGLALHPGKQILATTSDDQTWKMWVVPSGDIIMTGEGHCDWVSDCDFHPAGASLATTSGDQTVKIWDFSKAACVHTFTDHKAPVWSCMWHSCGDFLATSSMDNTAKVWDLNSLRCRYTLRGHADSVNTIEFLDFSNILVSSSADKTVSLWDARTGICAQTFYGHMHSVNHATFNLQGDTIVSCDSNGVVKLWDVRTVAPMASFDVGPHPANKLAFDPPSSVVIVASNDSTIKMYEISSGQIISLVGHEDSVQCLAFDHSGEFIVSGSSDGTIRIWS